MHNCSAILSGPVSREVAYGPELEKPADGKLLIFGHRGKRAENSGCSGAFSSSTMMVRITAKTASEK